MAFKRGQSGNPAGKPPGAHGWFTEARNQLRQALPAAIERVKEGAAAGDPDMIKLLFSVTFPRVKAAFPPVSIDFDCPRAALVDIKAALRAGNISSDHADSLLSTLERAARLETAIALQDAQVIDTEPLDMAKALTVTAAQCGDLSTAQDSLAKVLQYSVPRPQPEPPQASGTVSAEPIGLDGEDWESAYANPDGVQHD